MADSVIDKAKETVFVQQHDIQNFLQRLGSSPSILLNHQPQDVELDIHLGNTTHPNIEPSSCGRNAHHYRVTTQNHKYPCCIYNLHRECTCMFYVGSFISKQEGSVATYTGVLLAVKPVDEVTVDYPEIIDCHGKGSCGISDQVRKLHCKGCYGYPTGRDWPLHHTFTDAQTLEGLSKYIEAGYLCPDLIRIDLSKDSELIEQLKLQVADLDTEIAKRAEERGLLIQQLSTLGVLQASLIEL